MSLTDVQSRFLRLYLGAAMPGDPAPAEDATGGTGPSVDPMEIWREAKEAVDNAIERLRSALKSSGDAALERIADYGLNGLSDGNQTALMRRLFDYRSASADTRDTLAGPLVAEIAKYREMLFASPVIDLCERNPFGVAVAIRKPLDTALDRIEKSVAS